MRAIASILLLLVACHKSSQVQNVHGEQAFEKRSATKSVFNVWMDSCVHVLQRYDSVEIKTFAATLATASGNALTSNDLTTYLSLRIVRAQLGYTLGGAPNLSKALERATDTAGLYLQTFGEESQEYLSARLIQAWIKGDAGDIPYETKEVLNVLDVSINSNLSGKDLIIADCFNTLGVEANLINDHVTELDYLKKAESQLRLNLDISFTNKSAYFSWLNICNSLSVCYLGLQDYSNALYYADLCITERRRHGLNHPMLAIPLMVKARTLAFAHHEADSAIHYINQAIAICENAGAYDKFLAYSGHAAEILGQMGDTSGAINRYENVLAQFPVDTMPPDLSNVKGSLIYKLIRIYLNMGNQLKANKWIDEGDKLIATSENYLYPYITALLKTTRAESMVGRNGYENVVPQFEQSMLLPGINYVRLLNQKNPLPDETPYNMITIFARYANLKHSWAHSLKDTLSRINKLVECYHVNRQIVRLLNNQKTFVFNQNAAHVFAESERSSTHAIEEGLQCLLEIDSLMAGGRFRMAQGEEIASPDGRFASFLEFVEASKANLLEDKLNQDRLYSRVFSNEENQKRILQLKTIDSLLNEYQRTGEVTLRDRMHVLSNDYVAGLDKLKSKYHLNVQSQELADIESLKKASEGKAIFNYFEGKSGLFQINFIHGQVSIGFKPFPANFKEEMALMKEKFLSAEKVQALKPIDMKQFHDIRSNWYAFLIGEKLDMLPTPVNHLVIIPSVSISEINYDYLKPVDAADTTYLIQKYPIHYELSAAMMLPFSSKSRDIQGVVAFASENFSETGRDAEKGFRSQPLNTLRFTKREAEAIAEVTKGSSFTHVTPETFCKEAPKYGIVHISTHAVASDRVAQPPYLIFEAGSDGSSVLTTTELNQLDMKASLCMLSACRTGLGGLEQEEGVFSLGRAFLNQGIPAVGVSMWSIPDEQSTVDLMKSFYVGLKTGLSKSEALRRAKLEYLAQTKGNFKAHPVYWAGMILVGNDAPLHWSPVTNRTLYLGIAGITFLGALFFYFFRRFKKS